MTELEEVANRLFLSEYPNGTGWDSLHKTQKDHWRKFAKIAIDTIDEISNRPVPEISQKQFLESLLGARECDVYTTLNDKNLDILKGDTKWWVFYDNKKLESNFSTRDDAIKWVLKKYF